MNNKVAVIHENPFEIRKPLNSFRAGSCSILYRIFYLFDYGTYLPSISSTSYDEMVCDSYHIAHINN